MRLSEILAIVELIMGAASDEQIDAGLADLRRALPQPEVPLRRKGATCSVCPNCGGTVEG